MFVVLQIFTFGHPLCADLDPWLAESLDHCCGRNLESSSSFSCIIRVSYYMMVLMDYLDDVGLNCSEGITWEGSFGNVFALSLVVTTLGLELNSSAGHDTSSQHVTVKLLLGGETKDIEGILSVLKLLVVINGSNSGLALGDIDIVVDVR